MRAAGARRRERVGRDVMSSHGREMGYRRGGKGRSADRCLQRRKAHEAHTSLAVTLNASQSILGRMFRKKEGLYSMSDCSSSASLKWRGKERGEVLHALTAQVRKFTVNIFILESLYQNQTRNRYNGVKMCCLEDDDDLNLLLASWADLALHYCT